MPELCIDCHHPKDDPNFHLDAPGTNWGAALHWFKAKKVDKRWASLAQRFPMPNPVVRHVAEVSHDQHYHLAVRWADLNPQLQQHYYRITEAVLKALGKL